LKRKKPRKAGAVKGRSASRRVTNTKVQRIPPTAEAARDEGPRLIPLTDRSKEPSRLEHYLELADRALGVKREPKAGDS
jgi:hypothetical protein